MQTRPAATSTNAEPYRTPKKIVLAEEWRRYTRTGSREARDQLVLAYSPIVKYAAGRIASRLPPHIEFADLVSFGIGGLIEAVERFDPDRAVAFESYAGLRIRGAIFDGLRSLDWVPRSVREEARHIQVAISELTARLHRVPTDSELAAELSMDTEQLGAAMQRVADTRIVALDEQWDQGDGAQHTRLDTLPDADAPDPPAIALATELRDHISEAIGQLPGRERVILALRYQQELTNGEIGDVLGISESRVSQLHAQAVLRLRAIMPDGPGLSAVG
jgi:RNA polymerase sigma factor for flagellar operon FliA